MRNAICCIILGLLLCLPNKSACPQTMYIGDVDGFGFGGALGLNGAYGGPADRDGNGLLEATDVLPDLNGDGYVHNKRGDNFDNRTVAETNDTNGAQWTDVSLSKTFAGRPGLADDVFFTFNFPVPSPGDPGYGQDHFVSFVYGDYEVSPMYALVEGTQVALNGNKSDGRLDGRIWRTYTSISWNDMLDGQVTVEIVAPNEPYVAFDYALLDLAPVPVPVPAIYVHPANLNFGEVPVGDTSTPLGVAISNSGDENLEFVGFSITGTDAIEFGIQQHNCPNELLPTESCAVDVIFQPTSFGEKQASLAIQSNDPDTPVFEVGLLGGGPILPATAEAIDKTIQISIPGSECFSIRVDNPSPYDVFISSSVNWTQQVPPEVTVSDDAVTILAGQSYFVSFPCFDVGSETIPGLYPLDIIWTGVNSNAEPVQFNTDPAILLGNMAVGGTAFMADKIELLAPWITLAALMLLSAGSFAIRRLRKKSEE